MEDASGFLNSLALGDVLGSLGIEDADGLQQLGVASKSSLADRSAIYKDEYADDDLSEEEDIKPDVGEDMEAAVDQELQVPALQQKLSGEDDDYDDEGPNTAMDVEPQSSVPAETDAERDSPAPAPKPVVDVKQLFPTYDQDKIIDFTEMLSSRPRKRPKLANNPVKIAVPPANEIPEARSTRHLHKEISAFGEQRHRMPLTEMIGDMAPKHVVRRVEQGIHVDDAYDLLSLDTTMLDTWNLPSSDMLSNGRGLVELSQWEDDVIWDSSQKLLMDEYRERYSLAGRIPGEELPFRNADIENGDWSEAIIVDSTTPHKDFTRLQISANDPDLIVRRAGEDEEANRIAETALGKRRRGGAMWGRDAEIDKYNLSNDRIYESLRESRKKVVRQTFGVLDVLHAWPAIKLQLPFYRTSLSKHEARAFHRPSLQFPLNAAQTFSKVRSVKKRKDASSKATSVSARRSKADNPIKNTADLSLKDTVPFILTEYTEEYPPIMSNAGMGSIFVNYYRKKDAKDESTPKCELGQPFILDVNDESPFLKFGIVEPGQVVPSIYNNLFRAPLFKQNAYPTDFLCIRTSNNKGEVNYYLREIKQMYVVGQTYPLMEVPGPHSRKVTSMQKLRLQAIAARLIDRAEHHRVKIMKLIRYFPDTSELQMRQRLKEFMEYVRRGPNQGFWVLKSNAKTYEECMRDVKPEDCVLAESMQVGQRYLLDAGYGKAGEDNLEEEEDETKMDVEQQLAPWIVTKNFMNAAQNKAMLRLHGDGDPTGRGEAFNFVRVSMKEIFLRENETMEERMAEMRSRPKSSHKYNVAEQQEIYKEEIARIWKSQWKALTSKVAPKLTDEDKRRWEQREKKAAQAALAPSSLLGDNYAASPSHLGANINSDTIKVLRIKRQKKDGEWETEIVRDPSVIRAYVRHRIQFEEENTKAEELEPTGDVAADDKRRKKLEDYIANLKHNQERRMQRKNAAAGVTPDPLTGGVSARKPRGSKAETTRKCGNCGQVGHMKTNKRCPRWAEFNDPNRDKSKPAPKPAIPDGASPGPSTAAPTPAADSPAVTVAAAPSPALPTESPFAGTLFDIQTPLNF